MTNSEINDRIERRGPDGRFLPGHQPPRSPGRPPGPNGIRARAERLASERLEEMLGSATEVIESELESGNAQVAMWLVDRVRPSRRADFIEFPQAVDLGTTDGILEAAEQAMAAVGRGELSLADARSYGDLLARQASLLGLREIETLRSEVAALTAKDRGMTIIPGELPVWGKLRERLGQDDPQSEDA